MLNILKKYIHPLSGKLIFWNILLLVFVKLVLPQSAFQIASLVGSVPIFDSREIISFTNEARSTNQLAPLKANSQLDIAAEEKLNDMAIKEYFAHISPTGVTPWFWIQKAQYKYGVDGENLAIGFTTSQDTVKAWLNSPSHKANIMNGQYQDIGVAVKGVKIGETTGILVVQVFGVPTTSALVATNTIPLITPKLSPVISPSVASGQTKGEIVVAPELVTDSKIAIQYVSTNTEIPAVRVPSQVQLKNATSIRWTGILNNTFAIYSLLSALLSIVAFFSFERSRHMALKMSLHSAIFMLAVLVPVAGVTPKAMIF